MLGALLALALIGQDADRPEASDLKASTHVVEGALAAAEALRPKAILADPRETLLYIGAVDQSGREALFALDISQLTPDKISEVQDKAWAVIFAHDLENQRILKALLPRRGWFARKQYGARATEAAFFVVQHATNDPALMKDALRRMGVALRTKDVDPSQYALLFDRVALAEGRPQRFGTQWICEDGVIKLRGRAPDKRTIEENRKALAFDQSLEENRRSIYEEYNFCRRSPG